MKRKIRKKNVLLAFLMIILILLVAVWFAREETFLSGFSVRKDIDLSCPDCNVIFLIIELLRADHVGLLNPEMNNTPNIDQFFHDAIIFEDVSSISGLTSSSCTATFTSTEAILNEHCKDETKWMEEGRLLIDYFPTIAETLSRNEYYTISLNSGRCGKRFRLDRGFIEYSNIGWTNYNHVTNFMESYEKQPKEPYFIFFHSISLHYPYAYPLNQVSDLPDELNIVSSDINRVVPEHNYCVLTYKIPIEKIKVIDGKFRGSANDVMYTVEFNSTILNFTYDDYYVTRKRYENQVRYVDSQLSRIFEILDTSKTIVVLYSNHGEGLFDNGLPNHGRVYQSNIHVPLLIKHPKIDEQIRISTPVTLIDLASTIYEMLGITIDHELTTHSLVSLISGGKYERDSIMGRDKSDEYIREDNWKLRINYARIRELFNLSTDPHEEKDLIDAYPRKAMELESELLRKKLEQLSYADRMTQYYGIDD